MGSGFSKMKKQARLMEEQYEKMREEMKTKEVVGTAGNGLVTVTLNGDKELKSIQIRPECVDVNDLEGLQDLIKAAVQDGYQKIDAESNSMSSFPGFSF
jgi:DNA-binding YbaB/EbfC family protein